MLDRRVKGVVRSQSQAWRRPSFLPHLPYIFHALGNAPTIQVPQWPSGDTEAIRDHFELLLRA
jgi:hypothetical protein